MTRAEAIALIRPAVGGGGTRWADLGAGSGTFTEALALLLGARGTILAIDRDPAALERLRSLADRLPAHAASVQVARAELDVPDSSEALAAGALDGALLANVLHFFREPVELLKFAATRLAPGGRLVVIEYEGARESRWVPHPLPFARLEELALAAQLGAPRLVTQQPSRYHGALYCAVLDR